MELKIGETILRLRRERGLTQEQLAAAVGVYPPAVSKWERGVTCPDIALLAPLARALGATVDRLLSFTPGLTCLLYTSSSRHLLRQNKGETGPLQGGQRQPQGLDGPARGGVVGALAHAAVVQADDRRADVYKRQREVSTCWALE